MFNLVPILGTLLEAIEFYLKDCEAHGQSLRTIEGKAYMLGRFVQWAEVKGITSIHDVDNKVLEAYLLHLRNHRQKNGRPLTEGTLRNSLTSVKVFFDRLYYYEQIEKNKTEKFNLPAVPLRLPTGILTYEQVNKMMDVTNQYGIKGVRDRAVLETYFATGMRRMALAKLRIDDLDIEKNMVTLIQGKGKKDHRVPISDRACHWVNEYLENARPYLSRLWSHDVLFLSNEGHMYNASQLSYLVDIYLKRAGLKKQGSCNVLRHTCATLMLENGADIRHIQEMLGHADISTTQIYTHVSPNKLKDVYERTHPSASYVT